jgi:hypothetical protein
MKKRTRRPLAKPEKPCYRNLLVILFSSLVITAAAFIVNSKTLEDQHSELKYIQNVFKRSDKA